MMTTHRDDFSQKIKDDLAKRASFRCSNPNCQKPTIGAQKGDGKSINIGVAAHIAAAAPGGPRYDASMTSQERSSFENGIWLCANCSTLIDKDERYYTVDLLKNWKHQAEDTSHNNMAHSTTEVSSSSANADIFNLMLLKKDLAECLKWFSLFEKSPHIILDSENFPLPQNWEKLIADNNSFLDPQFAMTLYDICSDITALKQLMADESERIRIQYPRNKLGRIADVQIVRYCNRLDNINSRLAASFTQTTLDILSEKIKQK